MKKLFKLKIVLASFLLLFTCKDEDFSDADYSIYPPDNVSAHFVISQDNTGTVTITPRADGALKFDVNPGNGTDVIKGVSSRVVHNKYMLKGLTMLELRLMVIIIL